MEKMKTLLIFLFLAALFTSCGGSGSKEGAHKGDLTDKFSQNAGTSRYDSAASEDNSGENRTVEQTAGEERQAPRLVEHGTVSFSSEEKGAKEELPLFGVAATYGVDSGFPPAVVPSSPLPEIPFVIPANQRDRLAVYWVNTGGDSEHGILLLGPAGWEPVEAEVGANGSIGVSLENPEEPEEKLIYRDTAGGCQGCAIASMATYFPTLREWAEEQGFPGTEMKFRKQTLLSPRIISYSREHTEAAYEINGVAYQQHEEGNAWFRMEEMSSAASKHELAATILNFFVEIYDRDGLQE